MKTSNENVAQDELREKLVGFVESKFENASSDNQALIQSEKQKLVQFVHDQLPAASVKPMDGEKIAEAVKSITSEILQAKKIIDESERKADLNKLIATLTELGNKVSQLGGDDQLKNREEIRALKGAQAGIIARLAENLGPGTAAPDMDPQHGVKNALSAACELVDNAVLAAALTTVMIHASEHIASRKPLSTSREGILTSGERGIDWIKNTMKKLGAERRSLAAQYPEMPKKLKQTHQELRSTLLDALQDPQWKKAVLKEVLPSLKRLVRDEGANANIKAKLYAAASAA